MTTLFSLNTLDDAAFAAALTGIYEHSPWIAERAAPRRPFATPAALKLALREVVDSAAEDEQLSLLRAHPELAGKAAIAGELTEESTSEQKASGLNLCSPEEYARLQELNAVYNDKFGFPFILAVKGPTGRGLTRGAIIETFARRLKNTRADEFAEALRQVHRIAEIRLNALLGTEPALGAQVMDWCETIGTWSDDENGLTCAYLTPAHRRTAAQIADWMRQAGMIVHIDAVGNVAGRYASNDPQAKTLMTGSHYDTVRNGGKYDGRLGILLPIAIAAHLHARGERLPFHLDVVGFAEEEGVRFRSTFLGSSAITGRFDAALLDAVDADGITLREAIVAAGHELSAIPGAISAIARKREDLLGFVEVHIEQGPVLLERGLPLGVVTAIAGSSRYLVELAGVASHAGTTPMGMRRDAAAAAAEIVLLVEGRCTGVPALVGTVGQLEVPGGSVNVIPGACRLSLDIRAADDAVRLAAVDDILAGISAICARRGIEEKLWKIVEAEAAPCAPRLMDALGAAIERQGLPRFDLLSGAGHDAMQMAQLTEVAMLFTRCGNGGISHNPLETMTADDAELAAQVLLDFLRSYAV
ncbi:allantoate amidohydrolase [Massilia sp. Leaf139]|uniref:allantoate amidohydrolase n=1 Tax=Massilia sp. Leaf139 TaxID=1736272 RepID=UPI0006FD03AC|nr:allantoate amidohydrolase [Massilia sp. Leaf139]KQQ91692.1 allantoate amidohydrolase [Massilia sp. Leaf139]